MFETLIRLVASVFLLAPLSLYANSIHQAVRAKDIVTLESLLNTASIDEINASEKKGITPLHLAGATDFYQAVKLLIDHGADVNSKTSSGFTPLHWAASKNAVDAVELLLANGADVNAKAKSGITPLHWAASKNAADSIKLLLAAGADINAKTQLSYTPLHLAVKNDPYCEAAVLLAKAQADIEEQSGFLTAADLPDESDTARRPQELTEPEASGSAAKQQNTPPPVVQGAMLQVNLGLDSVLEFVWVDTLKLWFLKYEVTNRQYRHYKPAHSSRSYEGLTLNLSEQPAVYVSWHDADDYCQWLNTTYSNRIPANCEFRLPTADEWSFTAACGDERKYPWGNEWPPLYGNFSDMTARKELSDWHGILGYDDGYPVTCPVADSGMSEWGIYGLAGNVWEWCSDWLDNKDQQYKLRKGGSWDFDPQPSLEVNAIGMDKPTAKYDTIGIRIVVAPKPAPPEPQEPPKKNSWF